LFWLVTGMISIRSREPRHPGRSIIDPLLLKCLLKNRSCDFQRFQSSINACIGLSIRRFGEESDLAFPFRLLQFCYFLARSRLVVFVRRDGCITSVDA
jgi:hypothetical protein